MKRTAIYIRVSTDAQAKEGDSVPAQKEALLKYIKERPDLTLAGEYIDDGVSGTKFEERDELQRMLSDVKAGKIDQIAFVKLDRFYRSIRHYTATQEVLDRYNVTWVAIWEPIYDTSTPAGRLIVNQMMSIAQFEAENTSQRIKQVFDYKRKKGEVLSGRHPFGYKIENKHLVPVPEQVDAVKFVFDTYRQTSNLGETLRRCAGTGTPTEKMGLKKMLKNEIYIGVHNGKDDFCEPIISKEDFAEVQRLLKINYKSGKNKHEYIFSGIIRCGCCGHKMSGTQTSYKKAWYRCATYWNSVKRCENKTGFSERMMEEYLLSHLRDLIGDQDAPKERIDDTGRFLKAALNASDDGITRRHALAGQKIGVPAVVFLRTVRDHDTEPDIVTVAAYADVDAPARARTDPGEIRFAQLRVLDHDDRLEPARAPAALRA